jgi:hypothetical protein
MSSKSRRRSPGVKVPVHPEPIDVWVADVRSRAFRSEAHRQSLAVATSSQALDDQAFIDAISVWKALR